MKKLIVLTVVMTLLSMGAVAQAFLMPGPGQDGQAYLHVGNPPSSGTYLFGSEVTSISDTHLGIQNVDGPGYLDPVWLVLGLANNTGGSFALPSLTLSGASLVGSGYAGQLSAGETLYLDVFGIQGDASQSFTNWSAADLAVNGIVANTFGIYVYELTSSTFAGKSIIDVTFGSSIGNGTFAVAIADTGTVHNGQKVYATTPFTETGLTHGVPEPSSLLLLGSGLIGLGFWGRKKFRK